MTNSISDFPLNLVNDYKFTQREVRIEGYETSKEDLVSLLEMFSRAEYNVLYKERPSGPAYVVDLTSDQRNIVFCSFDTEELITGWYALKSIKYLPNQQRLGHFPFRIVLLYVGTLTGYQQWYAIQDIGILSNDWGI